jgi:hypothetical protein
VRVGRVKSDDDLTSSGEIIAMSELRAPRRASSNFGSRRRSVQGRLSIALGEDGDSDALPRPRTGVRGDGFRRPVKASSPTHRDEGPRRAPPVFHPLAYRGVVASWTIEDREHWGRRANELEETGLAWRDAEAQAFVETWHRIRRAGPHSEPTTESAGSM